MAKALAVKECYAQLDGSGREWKVVRSAFDRILHKDLVYETQNGSLNYDQYMESLEEFHRAGGVIELETFYQCDSSYISYSFRTLLPNGIGFHIVRKGTLMDGKLIHIEETEEGQAQIPGEQTTEPFLTTDMPREIKQLIDDYANFAGSGREWRDILPIYDGLFHKELVHDSGTDMLSFEQYQSVVAEFSEVGEVEIGNVVLETPAQIRFILRMTLPDGKELLTERIGSFKDGKLSHVRPIDGICCQELVDPLRLDAAKVTPDIHDLKHFFMLLNGSTEWGDIQPFFDRLFHDKLKVVTVDGEANYRKLLEFSKEMNQQGAVAELESVLKTPDSIKYSGHVIFPDGDKEAFESKATFKDGKIFRVQPTGPASLQRLIDHSRAA